MTKTAEIWAIITQIWHEGLWGIDVARFSIALGLIILSVCLRRGMTNWLLVALKHLTARTQNIYKDQILASITRPMSLLPIIMGFYLAVDFLPLTTAVKEITYRLIVSAFVLMLFWVIYEAALALTPWLRKLEHFLSMSFTDWLIRASRIVIILIGGTTILEIWGIQVGTILAGFGLIGVAVALGAQDLFKNLIAGLLVLSENRFTAGDWVLVEGSVEGVVEKIGFRSTRILRFDNAPVWVPNAALSDKAVTNFSRRQHRQISWIIGIEYKTTVEQLRFIRDQIEDTIRNDPAFCSPDEADLFVRIDCFNQGSIDILVYCFTRSTVWGDWLRIKENLAYRIKEIVEESGSDFAFPTRTLHIKPLSGAEPDIFVPPSKNKNTAILPSSFSKTETKI